MLQPGPAVCSQPNIAVCALTFRIVVLAWDRPASLRRLLTSLDNTDFTFGPNQPGWTIQLQVQCSACEWCAVQSR
jgi:hypothetical protein